MALRFEQSLVINAAADKVFEYVANLENMPDWGNFTTAVRKTSSGPVGVGTTYEADGKQFGKHTDKVTVTRYEPGKAFATESRGDAGESRNWYELADQGGAITVTKGFEITKPALSTRLAAPIVRAIAGKNLMKDLVKIKAKIEGTT
jgi:uncharacterized membrane protein